ncbi:MAG: DUF4136 domain-containing protein [Erythrobacter sp.]|nr:DUF4136 domain-containing protein [Erythrobacter sp.]
MTAMSSIKSLARLGLPLALVLGVSACATPFKADVSRFAVPLPAPQGQTFAVVAEDPKLAGGLEFSLYADMVAKEMEQLGYARASSPETANMLVRFDYGVDNGRERVRSDYGGVGGGYGYPYWGRFGGFGGFNRGYAFGFYDPYLGGGGVRSYTVYTSGIDVKIDRTADGQRLFEGKAEAVSRTNRLPNLVPNLVDAIFTDFPGSSGETVRITIKDDEKTVRPTSDNNVGY